MYVCVCVHTHTHTPHDEAENLHAYMYTKNIHTNMHTCTPTDKAAQGTKSASSPNRIGSPNNDAENIRYRSIMLCASYICMCVYLHVCMCVNDIFADQYTHTHTHTQAHTHPSSLLPSLPLSLSHTHTYTHK